MTLKTTRHQALNIRVTPAEAEMVRAAADAMGLVRYRCDAGWGVGRRL